MTPPIRQTPSFATAMLGAALAVAHGPAGAARVDVVLPIADDAQRSAITRAMTRFQATTPHTVSVTFVDPSGLAEQIGPWIRRDGTDAVALPAGRPLRRHARRGHLRSLEALGPNASLRAIAPAARPPARVNGRAYGIPIAYRPWGLYYHKPTFQSLDLEPPETWAEFRRIAQRLKANRVTPVALGAKNGWPLLAWADHMLARSAGPDRRRALLTGAASWTAPRPMRALRRFRRLFAADHVIPNWDDLGWQAPIGHVLRGYAGMYLIGSFWLNHVPEDRRASVAVAPFPEFVDGAGRAAPAPTRIMAVPAAADAPAAAARLLRFVTRAETQNAMTATTAWRPTRADLSTADSAESQSHGRTVLRSTNRLVPPLARVADPAIRRRMRSVLLKLAKGAISPRKAAMAIDAAASAPRSNG